ncbi:DUF2771 family protein [Corynebacterium poyangense]|uniref:DUF2771 family protein n=1 Tax=Corynebacterium poyangense TaxID=2684405 RepID=A0A7H0SMR3_9CORY|nr:DUF2771 domain-containing protein [Corynebacterium poyangense]MBZ8176336.1 DUF2771 family protein [Corynebacterium poyangense]QNQ89838.1 DUF2771 family protein [Corynebacterium poyangense]
MARSRQAKKKSLIQVLALVVAAVIVIVAVIVAQNWWNNRPDPEPRDVSINATVGDRSIEISPYQICEAGVPCPEGDIPSLEVGPDEELTLEIPRAIYNHDWSVVTIYDNPAANDQSNHGPYDTTSLALQGSKDPLEKGGERPRLVVVEITSMMIGHNDQGEETVYQTVWSLNARGADALGK